jgi:Uma2 family endonuclease
MTNAAARRNFEFSDYLVIEEMSREVKHEFVNGEIFAMADGSVEHAALSSAIGALLTAQLRGQRCRVYSADLRIRIREAGVATYADATVICDPVERDTESPTHVTNPRLVVEVLSPSTEAYDRHEKRLYYQPLPSLREYVLVAQDRRRVEVWRRDGEAWVWSAHETGARVPLPSLGLELDVDELYALAGVAVP